MSIQKGFLFTEKRNKNKNDQKIDPQIKSYIRANIKSFSRIELHFEHLRARTARELTDESLNLNTTTEYRLYIDTCIIIIDYTNTLI